MVTLEKIQAPLFPRLYEAFLIDDDPYSGEQEWRHVFDYQWDQAEDHCGYALLDEDRVVGMLGMIFSERRINGRQHKFCNLHTWWVDENYRGRSLALMKPVTSLAGYTITHFTPCDTVRAVTKRIGFKDLNSQLRILLPWGGSRIEHNQQFALSDDPLVIAERLGEPELKIFLDHQPYGCGHLLIDDGDEYCYVLFTHVTRHRIQYCHIHYISNLHVFAKNEPMARGYLLRNYRARFVAIDDRLIQGMRFRFSFNFWAPANALYKSSDVQPAQVDNLYSDVVFLKLTVLPDISHELKALARRWWPLTKN